MDRMANRETTICSRLAFEYNYTLCLSRLPMCFSVVNFAQHNREKDGAVKGKEIKNSIGTNNVSASQRRANVFERIFWSPIPIYGTAIVLILVLIATILRIRQQ